MNNVEEIRKKTGPKDKGRKNFIGIRVDDTVKAKLEAQHRIAKKKKGDTYSFSNYLNDFFRAIFG